MKKQRLAILWVTAGCISISFLVPGLAQAKKNEEKEKAQAVSEAAARRAVREKETASRLNETEWEIQLSSLSGGQKKEPLKDTLRFEKGKVSSQWLVGSGYPSTNYTLTAGEDGSVVWETMQTREGEGVAFWRGELSADAMRGILSKHPQKGDAIDYSFSGRMTGKITPPPVVENVPVPVSASPSVSAVPSSKGAQASNTAPSTKGKSKKGY